EVGFADDRPPPDVLGEGGFGLSGILELPIMPIVLGEKSTLWLRLTAEGDPGHGSLPPQRQAIVNLGRALREVQGHGAARVHPVMREQFRILAEAASGARTAVFAALASGAGTVAARALSKPLRASGAIAHLLADTVTPTSLTGGQKHNVVPATATASLDCRLLPDTDVGSFVGQMQRTLRRYGVTVEAVSSSSSPVTERGALFSHLEAVSQELPSRPVTVPSLTPGMTDVRYFRALGARGYGWVPLILDTELLGTIHGHDERMPVDGFLEGVEAMAELVRRAAGEHWLGSARPGLRN
ncbi:MAG: M20/M25/M40 family metallo-hydrolase, partial [Actinomycetota bacterium]|nr:M20/M25/M40 family metallo-hydrolase [Actinomycetota bacterium]